MLPKYRTYGGKRVPIRRTFHLDLIPENYIGRSRTHPNNLTKIKVKTRFQIQSQTRLRSFFSIITSLAITTGISLKCDNIQHLCPLCVAKLPQLHISHEAINPKWSKIGHHNRWNQCPLTRKQSHIPPQWCDNQIQSWRLWAKHDP